MQPGEWARVKEIFLEALDEPLDRREAILERLCEGDAVLRQQVQSLLDQDAAENAPHAPALPDDASASEAFGTELGPFRLVRELGHGGMGTVYLADRADGAYRQQVAIKVIRQAAGDPDLERRFRRERQILASLNHPHIARLLDGGVSRNGQPYLVMEYVDGEPLLAFATRAALSVRARLDLFLEICAAVSYAHGRLVVHRDLKPSNILVTADAEPKLLDFGLAQIVDATAGDSDGHTMTAFRAFTPAYASPEQIAGGDITTASDVYSLGVVLYELLTGVTPHSFARSTIPEMLRTLDTTTARPPSQVRDVSMPYALSGLAGDLDNIVLMALRREPRERYASVAALADDIHRYLEGMPIRARAHTPLYLLRKFLARHTAAVVAALVVAASLVGGIGVSLWQANIARAQRDRAAQRFADVRRLSNSLLFEISPRVERLPGATEARGLLVRRALEYLDSLAGESADDPELQSELASAYEKVGDLQGNPTNPNLVELDAAISSYEKARALRLRASAGYAPTDTRWRLVAENYRVLGAIYSQANDFDKATRELNEARRLYEQLAAAHPEDPALRIALAQSMHDLGRSHSNSSRYAGALAPFEQSISIAESVRQRRPEDIDLLRLLADSHAQYGLALSWEGRQKEGEAEMARAASIYEALVSSHPNDVTIGNGLWSVYWLSSSVYEEQDDVRSHQFALIALNTMQEIVAQDPTNVRARQQLAKSFSRLGQTATNTGRPTEAIVYLREAATILGDIVAGEARNGRLRSELALVLTRLAEARAARGLLAPALDDAERAAETFAAVLAESPADRRSVRNLVLAHQIAGEIHERMASATPANGVEERRLAEESYRRALDALLELKTANTLAESDAGLVKSLEAKLEAMSRRTTRE